MCVNDVESGERRENVKRNLHKLTGEICFVKYLYDHILVIHRKDEHMIVLDVGLCTFDMWYVYTRQFKNIYKLENK